MSTWFVVDWSPDVLPCAPRPMNGELLSSWVRRLATANVLTLPEMCAAIGDRLDSPDQAAVFDYGAPKSWRLALAAMARIPERWVWALDLQQQFPAAGREWFLHAPARPEEILSGFCPECLAEQVAARQMLHLKVEWSVALVTRCFRHELPLYCACPWCGRPEPVHFEGRSGVQCLHCRGDLTIRRRIQTPPSREPAIAAFERAAAGALAGQAPDPAWGGSWTARSFRRLVADLIWMLTTVELVDPSYGCAVVDRIVSYRFLPRDPYGADLDLPFFAQSWTQREAVVCAMLQVLLGPEADRLVGKRSSRRKETEPLRPFGEILRSVQRHRERLWARIGEWPEFLQQRAEAAFRLLEGERNARSRRREHRSNAL